MTNTPFAWSYSALRAFETCPRRYYLTRVTKQASESQTAATLEGNEIHKALELHLKGTRWLPDKYRQWVPLAERIKSTPGRIEVERQVALTRSFTETSYFGKDVWLRGKFDVRIVQPKMTVHLDWKTGKRKEDSDQLRLAAAIEFKINPHVETVHTGFVWLKDKLIDKETHHRDDSNGIWKDFMIRVQRMESASVEKDYPPRPSGLCKSWCPVGKRLCEHCGS